MTRKEPVNAAADRSAALTPRQHRFMLVLQARIAGSPEVGPTYEDLRADMGLSSKSAIARLVAECERRGRLSRTPNAERSLRVVMPVSDAVEERPASPLSAYSDEELLAELARRGVDGLSDAALLIEASRRGLLSVAS